MKYLRVFRKLRFEMWLLSGCSLARFGMGIVAIERAFLLGAAAM